MQASIGVILILFLSACSAQRDLAKAENLIERAITKGAKVKSDTIFKHVKFIAPSTVFKTTLTNPNWGDTVYIKGKDSTIVKIKRVFGPKEKVFVEVKSPERVIIKKVPMIVEKQISAGYSLWDLIILAIVSAVVGWLLLPIVINTVKRLK